MRLDIKAFGLTTGILWGLAVFLATLSSRWRGKGEHLSLLQGLYPGYEVSYAGSVIGLVYALATGLLLGTLFAWLYNRLNQKA